MKTLRMDKELESRIESSARKLGQTESQFMREGLRTYCDQIATTKQGQQNDRLSTWKVVIAENKTASQHDTPQLKRRRSGLHKRFVDGAARESEQIFGEILDEKRAVSHSTQKETERKAA